MCYNGNSDCLRGKSPQTIRPKREKRGWYPHPFTYLDINVIISPVSLLVIVATASHTKSLCTILQDHFSADRKTTNSLRKSKSPLYLITTEYLFLIILVLPLSFTVIILYHRYFLLSILFYKKLKEKRADFSAPCLFYFVHQFINFVFEFFKVNPTTCPRKWLPRPYTEFCFIFKICS